MRRRAWLGPALSLMLAAAAGCGLFRHKTDEVNYVVDAKLSTYNANTAAGRSSAALMVFARVLPGFSYVAPTGALIADTDIGSAEPQTGQGEEFTVRYTFNPKAAWSDGAPMTCEDLVLAWAALAGRLPEAGPASTLGYELISHMQCEKGQRTAVAVFSQHFPDWPGLFGPGTILPSHVLAKATGTDVVDALGSGDQASLRAAGRFWSSGWDFPEQTGAGPFDKAKFPASGPYRIDSALNGATTLARNEHWRGEPARTPRIKIWPKGFRPPVAGAQVVDIGKDSVEHLELPPGLRERTIRSLGIEQFVLSARGALAPKRAREAFALCLPRAALAARFGASAPPASGALSDSQDPWQLAPAPQTRYLQPSPEDLARARDEASRGQPLTIRVGYLGPDARRAALVDAVAQSCDPAGVRVVDASAPDFSPLAMAKGQFDAILTSSDLASGAGGAAGPARTLSSAAQVRAGQGENVAGYENSRLDEIIADLVLAEQEDDRIALLGQAEHTVWDDLAAIPLFAEPRSVIWSETLRGVVPAATAYGTGWNMDRWGADE